MDKHFDSGSGHGEDFTDMEASPVNDAVLERKSFSSGEPIAIIGMACRFPGASSIGDFWQLLESGGNSVSEIVPGFGNQRVDEMFSNVANPGQACRFCGYVDDIDQFDAGFFRISPVEAELLDPQHRMMLETTWLALEDAGIDPDRLKGSRSGVYTGISNDEYRMLVVESSKPAEAAACLYALSGTNLNGTAGRVSFVLGLMGPSKAVDAACASSLVSVHDAVVDLQYGKADLAIAGGIQAILNGRVFELRADAMMLSPDGQCKSFDASANGYVRGEGCGVVVLKRLSEAEADGDRIWAVIRGSAVNHGGASSGLTVPHRPALEKVIEAALSQAGVSASDVSYLEAHGTGTAVGDPIEIDAVSAVLCKGREASRPLVIGSVKTNVGHLESAAGIAGLIKAVLVVQRGVVPKHLHLQNLNPRVDWDRLPMQIPTSLMDLPRRDGQPRLAGVNSFGISGTNSHMIVQEYDNVGNEYYVTHDVAVGAPVTVETSLPAALAERPLPEQELRRRNFRLLPLSGKSQKALRDLAASYLAWLSKEVGERDSSEPLLSDMAWSASVGRSHFDHRAGIPFQDYEQLKERLEALVDAKEEETKAIQKSAKVAFVFTGQGSQWAGMGETLYESEPVVRAILDRCDDVFREQRGASLLDVMFGRVEGQGKLHDTEWEQPALYALECALTSLWESIGVRPDVVVGHSLGELVAAYVAGVFSLEDGMRFATMRGTLLSESEPGAMAAVFASADEVEAAVKALNESTAGVGLSISGDNGSHQVVSGPAAEIDQVLERFDTKGIRTKRLNTTRAFHSALLDPVLDMLESSLDGLTINPPSIPMISNLTGQAVETGQMLDGAYWRRHAREAVAFAGGVRTLASLGVDLVIEVGPKPLLLQMVASNWPAATQTPNPSLISSLQPPSADASDPAGADTFTDAVAKAYQTGLAVRFEGLFAGEARQRISLPSYPFQRERYWISAAKMRRSGTAHSLLGERHESASGEVTFQTMMFPTDPEWLIDHRVFDRVIAPGALYAAMAVSAGIAEGNETAAIKDMQLHSAMVFSEADAEIADGQQGRNVQVVLDASPATAGRRVQIFSQGGEEEWILHAECSLSSGHPDSQDSARVDLESLKASLSLTDLDSYYRARSDSGIEFGPSFKTLANIWSRPGEALGEISFPSNLGQNQLNVHPVLLDGCFQVIGVARISGREQDDSTYLPFGWERMWLPGNLPNRVFCHVRMSENFQGGEAGAPEIMKAELRICDTEGNPVGGVSGHIVKRATKAAMLSAFEVANDLLYEVVWRERAHSAGISPVDFLPSPAAASARAGLIPDYLIDQGFTREEQRALQIDLERLSRSGAQAALNRLGWKRSAGAVVDSKKLRIQLDVNEEHERLFRRMLEMVAKTGVLEEKESDFVVKVASDESLPDETADDVETFATQMMGRHPHGSIEIGLLRRCIDSLADVLRGQADPLTVLFGSGYPTPSDLYNKSPIARAGMQALREAIQALLSELPDGRQLKIIEIGAGTGSATATILPELPAGQFEYTFTDISAGFFAEAESRFGDGDGCIEYRPLDIENDPIAQGFAAHGYDLIIASNVLHATRSLNETLAHCRTLLAPCGQIVAYENLHALGWMDLTFGQLDGWWRFADDYRSHSAIADASIWRRVLEDTGFDEIEIAGADASEPNSLTAKGVILARVSAQPVDAQGTWILVADRNGFAERLAVELASRNQTVWLVAAENEISGMQDPSSAEIHHKGVSLEDRESWRSLLDDLPPDPPLHGIVHSVALDGSCGTEAANAELAGDVRRAVASALGMVQGMGDADAFPEKGTWFITRGAQVLEREDSGKLAGAPLWGFGKTLKLESPHLRPKMIDLDPGEMAFPDLVGELLYPDSETHVAFRWDHRYVARLVRMNAETARLSMPDDTNWTAVPDPAGEFGKLSIERSPQRSPKPKEVRIAVETISLNFRDVFRSLGIFKEGGLGRDMCGRVLEVGSEVSTVSAGDRIVGLGIGTFAAEMVLREELVTVAPPEFTFAELATIPNAFVTAALSFEIAGLNSSDRVLIHAGTGGVGLAAVQLAQACGAEIFATASAPKQAYLRSLGVKHVFDSRSTAFGKEVLERTDGAGVDVVLNSLTGKGFIEASLSCLVKDGRFVELSRKDILSREEMTAVRPDISYEILELDVMKMADPAEAGRVFQDVMQRLSAGELRPLIHSRWSMADTGAALKYMRSARHMGKIVITAPPIFENRVRQNRTYLITGGLGGIGCAIAGWLADNGAEAIVLNGRRAPSPEAQATIDSLRQRGINVQVEIADVTDAAAMDGMLAKMDRELPPLGGVVHSVGAISDGALTNQTWEKFEAVLWPKISGAWHLHQATADRDLDMFILFSSRVGVTGNPGQANHASANAFLDQLAGYRRALGLAGQTIAWGAWSEIGEAAELRERIEPQRASRGGRWFTPQQGLAAFDKLVRQDSTSSVAMSMDWSVFEKNVESIPPFFEDLLSHGNEIETESPEIFDSLPSRLKETSVNERENLLVSFLQQELQAVLRLPATPEPAIGFFDLGMDSLMAVEMRNRLNRALDGEITISNTAVFDYPSISAFAGYLLDQLPEISDAPQEREKPEPAHRPIVAQREDDQKREGEQVAIVGMACRFPDAPDIDSFWNQLEAGFDAVSDGRRDSGPWDGVVGDTTAKEDVYRRGGFVEGIDLFDAEFFGIRPIEARLMDPCQRLLLETSWHALEDAGIAPHSLLGTQSGVYAGISNSEYRDLIRGSGQEDSYLGTATSVALGRIAFVLGLTGPAIPLDMTCASSLAAVHQAAAALRRREVDLSLVGGVHAVFSQSVTKFMSDYGMLSSSGRCRAFDAGADGFVRGEGCGMVVMKRLSDAKADGDRIWGLVLGSSVNQNGASAALTVPRGTAQELVLEDSLAQAGISASEVDYLEAHATGSQLGDPIEVRASASVYGTGRAPNRPLLLGTVKTNIGHLEAAAGIAGLIKVLLAMRRGKIPKHLHCDDPNPHTEWDQYPVRITSEAMDWPLTPERPPRSGVSAFAISGANAHVIVEGNHASPDTASTDFERSSPAGFPKKVALSMPKPVPELPDAESPVSRGRRLLPLSGKSHDALRELAAQYLSWLDKAVQDNAPEISAAAPLLSNMAWTASAGRNHFANRAGITFENVHSLRRSLRAVAESNESAAPQPAAKVAFAYPEEGDWSGIGETLYESEPIAHAVLDRCEKVMREEHGPSLLEQMFGHAEGSDTAAWPRPAAFALQCALAALWSSVGIRPDVVTSSGTGALAAAYSAGVLSLEEGLQLAVDHERLAKNPSDADSVMTHGSHEFSSPSIAMINQATGRLVESDKQLYEACRFGQAREPQSFGKGVETLMKLGVDAVVEIGADAEFGTRILSAWPESELASRSADDTAKRPILISGQMRKPDSGDELTTGFIDAVAEAYKAGLTLDFAGLFAGEERCRISLPSYPFQRRRFWFNDFD